MNSKKAKAIRRLAREKTIGAPDRQEERAPAFKTIGGKRFRIVGPLVNSEGTTRAKTRSLKDAFTTAKRKGGFQ